MKAENGSATLEIRKLTAELLEDWLYFFDNTTCNDCNEWAGCYCMAPHYSAALQSEQAWEYSKSGAIRNRKCAEEHIKKGILQGYLAYCDSKVVGWCNVNDKQAYDSIFFILPWEDSEKEKKIKAIACFFIALDLRGKGIATQLLEKICSDATADGYEYIEAYPFLHDNNKAFTGPIAMYENAGFTVYNTNSGPCMVYRKYL